MIPVPPRYAELLANLLDGLGPDNILWGTDTPVVGPPHWQIEAFQTYSIPDQVVEARKIPQLTREIKEKILGGNVARIFKINVEAERRAIENDYLYKLRQDGNPLPSPVNPQRLRKS